jgi:cytochrome c oxidase accessory protein FixG
MNTTELQAAPVQEAFRDRVATVDKDGKRVWVYPQKPKGAMHRKRVALTLLYLSALFGLPFVKVGGHPLFLFNVIDRKFILFGQIFWPQDFFIFAVGMLLFIVFVALFTVVFGRVFCGWMCPQTIFMEMVFRKIEYWIEGDANHQRLLDKAPWTAKKIAKKSAKWTAFWIVSFLIANTFLAYVIGIDELKKIITEPVSQHVGGFVALMLFTGVFFFVYLWFREQVCTAVCPYGRLQGVLLDKDSMVVAYDYKRGEQRGKFRKNTTREIGDCIDCMQCVKVCPTGIDIRNGTQLECVNCTACIDACNHMMQAVGLEPNLIRLASENSIQTGNPARFTTRTKAYTVVMALLLCVEVFLLTSRSEVSATVLRTSGQLYQEQEGGKLSNLYNYKFINKTYASKDVTLRPENFKGEIKLVGKQALAVPKEGDTSGELFIVLPKSEVRRRKTDLKIGVYERGKKLQTVSTTFLGPFTAE